MPELFVIFSEYENKTGRTLVNNKIVVYAVTFVGFLILFLIMDQVLQGAQGLELFPSGGAH